jgi:hypothetical protein
VVLQTLVAISFAILEAMTFTLKPKEILSKIKLYEIQNSTFWIAGFLNVMIPNFKHGVLSNHTNIKLSINIAWTAFTLQRMGVMK